MPLTRSLQYRLSTALFALVVVAVALSWWSGKVREPIRVSKCIAAIERRGGVVTEAASSGEGKTPKYTVSLSKVLATEDLDQCLNAAAELPMSTLKGNSRVLASDQFVPLFSRSQTLRMIGIEKGTVTSTAAGRLRNCRSLHTLSLNEAVLLDESAFWRACGAMPEIREIYISNVTLTGEQIAQLKHCSRLELLGLCGVTMDPSGWTRLAEVRQLKRLLLNFSPVTDEILAPLSACSDLIELDLGGTRMNGSGFSALENLRQLETLELSKPYSPYLDLSNAPRVSETPADPLASGSATSEYNLTIQALPKLPRLRHLGLSGVRMPRSDWLMLSTYPDLEVVDGKDGNCPSDVVTALSNSRPRMRVFTHYSD
jgi:hypothetical protein